MTENHCLFCNTCKYKVRLCKQHYKLLCENIKLVEDKKFQTHFEYRNYFHNLRYSIIKMVNIKYVIQNMLKLYAISLFYKSKFLSNDLLLKFQQIYNKYFYSKLLFSEDVNHLYDDFLKGKISDETFRKKWPAKFVCDDGHCVRSLSEKLIDNWLFQNNIIHVYEKQVVLSTKPPVIILCDFYLPNFDVYIEYWGKYEYDYLVRKHAKKKLYVENNMNLFELEYEDLEQLDKRLLFLKLNNRK